ncbi:hypothetical protein QFZ62_001324 [Clavibacter sp. B3I6]|jgi:hypothetical protein|uniref:hypothetical protein n=1 Tax=Clavibacter sp. B3I6 TaxID=3042268 RepID=UPI002784A604|nr:hypothetical protein [Clavibacter sp. B3I6]MDQ0744016.1 hypothetical protein [Clavibacter sp. B3I6]
MAITNLPYDDERIVEGVTAATARHTETRDVKVDFTGVGVTADDTATVTATLTWTVSATDAVRILDAARVHPEEQAGSAGDPVALDASAAAGTA